ncbi:hypothetical protein GUJ93_ZPchr0005g16298 [Zizania palustris]|uniref:Uncharacterized protein n=1 Tax=Zizania palustris TaxID=103762 RepID=A0A8J5S3B9_ZIZPA|nr:hypothetical protein GUJ93_ZPchr0005g16298 [Zizania palustris]
MARGWTAGDATRVGSGRESGAPATMERRTHRSGVLAAHRPRRRGLGAGPSDCWRATRVLDLGRESGVPATREPRTPVWRGGEGWPVGVGIRDGRDTGESMVAQGLEVAGELWG